MKKILVLFIISCMLMTALVSCDLFGGDTTTTTTTTTTTPTTTTQKQDPPQPSVCEHADNDGDLKCDACGEVLFEQIKYTLNVSDIEVGTRSKNDINGKFTISSSTEVRNRTKTYQGVEYTKSVKFGSTGNKIVVSVPGTGTLRFIVQNGSSGADMQYIKVIAPDGTVQDIEFPGKSQSDPLYMIELEVTEGNWTITRGKNGGTQDIFYLELECLVAVAAESGFELVSDGQTEFLVGENLDTTGVRLNATYANGKTDTLSLENVTIDTSKVDMTQAGVYDVTVSYKEYAPITYQVSVYAPSMIELHYNAIEKLSKNSAAGNGVYFNHRFKEVYNIGEELDTRGLSVIVIAKCGEETLEFRVEDYEITGFDSSEAGMKALVISAYGLEEYQKIYVIGGEPVAHVKVDNENGDIIPGDIVDGYMTFTGIYQALQYLERVDAATPKIIEISEGLYTEKLEITLPNLTIRGAGADKTTIEWDSLYGLVDAGGFTHTTDSTATVAVREGAINCVIEDITISNYWNSQERMNAAGLGIERGLALLVQADRFIMRDSALLGIQDTLELFTGRQYFENVFISGYTDFIFGTNNTTYFKNCTIHVIDTTKDDNGTAGYITAFKGSNKGESDAIVYGTIFDGCKFTADEGVTLGCTAIGRPWGAYAAVAVINSELGGHISVKGYTGNKNERYVSMTAKPTDETVQYVEYNNTGAGALTEAVAGMKMLTAEEAAKYLDFATIFGTTNGKVTYLDPWDPKSEEVVVDDRTYYYFNGTTGTSGTSYTYDQNLQGTTGTFGEMTIDATKGKVTSRGSDTQINAGAKLIFNVEAGTLVTVVSYPGYGYYTLNGVAHNANDTFSMYFAEATEVVIEATETTYLYQVIINPDEEAPEEPTVSELKVDGMKVDYIVGEEFTLEGVVVSIIYSDHSIRPVSEYAVEALVNNEEAGEYTVVFTVGDQTVSVTVTFVADLLVDETTTFDLSATGLHIEGATGTFKALTIDATNGKFSDNGGGWTQVNAGTIITFEVVEGADVSVVAYSNAGNFDIVYSNGMCTITCTGDDYLKSITVVVAYVFSETTTVDLSATGVHFEGSKGEYAGLTVDATGGKFKDNGGGWVQVNTGTVITLNVAEGAQVSVSAYSNSANFDIVIANGVCTITAVGNDYLNAITVSFE